MGGDGLLLSAVAGLNRAAAEWAGSASHGLAVALLLVLLVGAVSRVAGRHLRPAALCWLWWLAAVKLALALAPLPHLSMPVLPGGAAALPSSFAAVTGLGAGGDAPLPAAPNAAVTPPAAPAAGAPTPLPTPAAWLLLLWAGGAAVGLAAAGRDAGRLARTARTARSLADTPLAADLRLLAVAMGLRESPRLAESPEVSAPMVTGLRRPLILVPEGFAASLTPEEARMALAHELAHLKRGDLYLAFVPFLARTLCFFVPFVPGLVLREWATAREAACDALALRATGAAPGVYSRLLLKVVARDHRPLDRAAVALGATASFHTLSARIERVRRLSGAAAPAPVRAAAGLSAAVAGLCGLCLLAPWRLTGTGEAAAMPPARLSPAVPFPITAADVADVPALDIRAGGDPDMRYLLIGAGKTPPPPGGHRLLVVLPGGDGSADFNGFIRRIRKFGLGDRYLVAQPIARFWDDRQKEQVVWPLRTNPWPSMRFATEDFTQAVVRDVSARYPVDARHVYVLGWASGGPAAYAAALSPDSPFAGAFVAMSVYGRDYLPPASGAKGRPFFLLHPSDAPIVPLSVAQRAASDLKGAGAKVELLAYEGGYGWHGNVYAQIRRGMRFLEEKTE